jgi:hypothetical protein
MFELTWSYQIRRGGDRDMKRALKNFWTGVMILMMLATAIGVFAEQTSPDADLPEGQSTDDSTQVLVSTAVGGAQEEVVPVSDNLSDIYPQENMDQENLEEKIPLAWGAEPTVAVCTGNDLGKLCIGDTLVLTAELNGFDGMKYSLQWQARDHGKWKDLDGENATSLKILITEDNADWAYRAAVDTQPVS